jgi:D-beta-D-heptose 7-phosphate kinase/D-beta-D-heptose 1-phosphate adenosyltransferase
MISRLTELVRGFGSPRVLVVGDLLLDRYLWGKVERISPEAPVPVLNVAREEERPGGAANVARNLVALGARAACAGTIGEDGAGIRLVELLGGARIDARGIVVDRERPTPLKTRCIAQSQQMLRIDTEKAAPLSKKAEAELLRRLARAVRQADLVVVSDYNKGCLTRRVLAGIMKCAKARRVPVVVGPKGTGYEKYRGCTVVAPNLKELKLEAGLGAGASDAKLEAAALAMLRMTRCEAVLLTRGERGMSLFRAGQPPLHVPARPRQVFDVTGAGDTSVATLGFALACGASLDEAARLANAAGGIAVTKVGVAAVSREELIEDLAEEHHARPDKVLPLSDLLRRLAAHRRGAEKVVFTNGCFDLLHAGHARTLRFARAQGDVLVVGINSDASVRRLKGPGRPLLREADRAEMLASMEDVDYVVAFSGDTPVELLKRLRPDVLVKGGDYSRAGVVGADLVQSWGGKVAVAPLEKGASTTNLVQRIRGH